VSFVTTQPDVLSGAASSLSGIGDAMVARNAAAAAPTLRSGAGAYGLAEAANAAAAG